MIPIIMSKDPIVTARQACHKQAVETWPSVLKELNKGLAEGPLPPWLIRGPQYLWTPSKSVLLLVIFEFCNSISVLLVSLNLLAHMKQWFNIHHQAAVNRTLTLEAKEEKNLNLVSNFVKWGTSPKTFFLAILCSAGSIFANFCHCCATFFVQFCTIFNAN